MDRRFYKRIKTNTPCSVIIGNKDYEGVILDICEEGMKIRLFNETALEDLRPKDIIPFSLCDEVINEKEYIVTGKARLIRLDPKENEIAVSVSSHDYEDYVYLKKAYELMIRMKKKRIAAITEDYATLS